MGTNAVAIADNETVSEKRELQDGSTLSKNLRKGLVRCSCPRCGVDHILKFLWTGKGIPKKFCHRCRSAVENINENCVYEVGPAAYRGQRSSAAAS